MPELSDRWIAWRARQCVKLISDGMPVNVAFKIADAEVHARLQVELLMGTDQAEGVTVRIAGTSDGQVRVEVVLPTDASQGSTFH